MKWILYLTINLKNLKIYVGVHETDVKWDYYLGCGCYANKPSSYNKAKYPLHAAICKYGVNSFKRITLLEFDTKQGALNAERLIVNESFIRRKDVYNCVIGGGAPPVHNKKVYQFNTNGELIKCWNSIKDVYKNIQCNHDQIQRVIVGKRIYKNYFWSYNDSIDISEYSYKTYKTSIDVYNENKELLNSFESISDAAKYYDFDAMSISNAIFENCKLHGLIFCKSDVNVDDFFKKIYDRKIVVKTPIYQYDKDSGEFIQKFNSIADAKKECGLKSHSRIISAAKFGKISAGYRWSYSEVNNVLNNMIQSEPSKPKEIGQYDLDGNLVKVWTINECRKQYPNCIKVCRGARQKAYGYIWKYQ